MDSLDFFSQDVSPDNVYAIIGEDGIRRLTTAFYQQVPNDDILAPMYPKDELQESERRLRDFLIFRFGGPPHYLERRGHPRLRMRHAPFPIDQRARDRWVALIDNALQQAALPANVITVLKAFFGDVASSLINRDTIRDAP